ncbi:hypothetical protein NKG05_19800 [Oerskovia sp. M15]
MAFGLFIVLLFVYGVNPGWPILLVPFWTLLAVLLGAAIGVASSAVMVKYRDVGYALPWFIQVLMYATPSRTRWRPSRRTCCGSSTSTR